MRLTPKHLVPTGALLWLLVAALATTPAVAANDCRQIEALIRGGYLDQALSAIGSAEPETLAACPLGDELATAHFERGRSLERAGDLEGAAAAYKAALQNAPGHFAGRRLGQVLEQLEEQKRATEARAAARHAQAAERLLERGLYEQATNEAVEALEGDPALELDPQLEGLFGGPLPGWRTLRRSWIPRLLVGAEMLIVALALLALLSLLLRALPTRALRTIAAVFPQRRYQIDSFAAPAVEGITGEGFASMVLAKLGELSAGQASARVGMVAAQPTPLDLSNVVPGLAPEGADLALALARVLQWALPPAPRIVGAIHPPGAAGPLVTVRIVLAGSVLETVTLKARDFLADSYDHDSAPGAVYQALAESVAVWLLFRLRRRWWRRGSRTLLGVSNWRSYALFRAGVSAFEHHRRSEAMQLFAAALKLEPDFKAAHANLGRLLIHHNDDLAIEHLQRATS